MQFSSYPPSEALRPYVKQYICLRADGSTDTMAPPEGDRRFRDGHHIQKLFPSWGMWVHVRNACVRTDNKVIDHSSFMIGPQTTAFELETLSGWFEAVLVEFAPAGIRAFLDFDLMKLHEHVYTVEETHVADLSGITREVQEAEDSEEAVRIIDTFLSKLLNVKDPMRMKGILDTVAAAEKAHCQISVGEMSSIACLSERQFSRSFRSYVGLTPKEYLRMLRWHMTINHLQKMTREGEEIDLHELALHMGYYDLSHMAMEFRAIGCSTPANFRQLGIPLQEDFTHFFD